MNTTTTARAAAGAAGTRILREGYGEGAWHGPDLKAALADVTPTLALWRPAPGRHNIAEIAVHHAYYTRSVRAKLTGAEPEPFVLAGDDWFVLPDPSALSWAKVIELVDREQAQLARVVADIEGTRTTSPLPEPERLDLVLGITCHAVYHAGQIQLIKRLSAGA